VPCLHQVPALGWVRVELVFGFHQVPALGWVRVESVRVESVSLYPVFPVWEWETVEWVSLNPVFPDSD